MERLSRREIKDRDYVKNDFNDIGVDYSDNMILYGYIDGYMSGILIQDNGLLTDENEFIKYEDIISINDTININAYAIAGLGLALGPVLDNMSFKTVKIRYNNGIILLKDVRKEDAIKFIHVIKEKINQNKVKYKNTASVLEEVKMAKSLLDEGAITEKEFQKIKEKIINKL